jgi:hypothetical protein
MADQHVLRGLDDARPKAAFPKCPGSIVLPVEVLDIPLPQIAQEIDAAFSAIGC